MTKHKIQNKSKAQISNIKTLVLVFIILILNLFCHLDFVICDYSFAQDIKQPEVAGTFYPDDPKELSRMIDGFLESANPEPVPGNIFAIISPHAGYGYSGQVNSFGYKLIKGKAYKTVVVIGPSHHYGFSGASVYPEGIFRTPLGDLEVDSEFAKKLLDKEEEVIYEPNAFKQEHSIEVQLPFLQRALTGFKIVPILVGDCTLDTCRKFAKLLGEAISSRQDVLLVASSDMYHGYDYEEAELIDYLTTLTYLKNMDEKGLYFGLREGSLQLCGGFAVVTTIILAKELGYNSLKVLNYTNSAAVTGNQRKGLWTVGYSSCVITAQDKGEENMLNKSQRKKLLSLARNSISVYLKTGKAPEASENDPALLQEAGAFVTLHKFGELRGCIGNLTSDKPLYLMVRDMAIESATGDPRFPKVRLEELKNLEIEISVLSPLEKIDSPDKIQLGVHGVLVKRGPNSGVYLPQVAAETGWPKEEFLSSLCAQKAGLPADAWKDKSTELYIFSAEVFSERNY